MKAVLEARVGPAFAAAARETASQWVCSYVLACGAVVAPALIGKRVAAC
jgi:hypothetical protein